MNANCPYLSFYASPPTPSHPCRNPPRLLPHPDSPPTDPPSSSHPPPQHPNQSASPPPKRPQLDEKSGKMNPAARSPASLIGTTAKNFPPSESDTSSGIPKASTVAGPKPSPNSSASLAPKDSPPLPSLSPPTALGPTKPPSNRTSTVPNSAAYAPGFRKTSIFRPNSSPTNPAPPFPKSWPPPQRANEDAFKATTTRSRPLPTASMPWSTT